MLCVGSAFKFICGIELLTLSKKEFIGSEKCPIFLALECDDAMWLAGDFKWVEKY